MYAIVDIAGKQYKIEKDKFVYTDKLQGEVGSKVDFTNVLMTGDGSKVNIGGPFIKGASISGKILAHVKDDKVISFKKEKKKRFQKNYRT